MSRIVCSSVDPPPKVIECASCLLAAQSENPTGDWFRLPRGWLGIVLVDQDADDGNAVQRIVFVTACSDKCAAAFDAKNIRRAH